MLLLRPPREEPQGQGATHLFVPRLFCGSEGRRSAVNCPNRDPSSARRGRTPAVPKAGDCPQLPRPGSSVSLLKQWECSATSTDLQTAAASRPQVPVPVSRALSLCPPPQRFGVRKIGRWLQTPLSLTPAHAHSPFCGQSFFVAEFPGPNDLESQSDVKLGLTSLTPVWGMVGGSRPGFSPVLHLSFKA